MRPRRNEVAGISLERQCVGFGSHGCRHERPAKANRITIPSLFIRSPLSFFVEPVQSSAAIPRRTIVAQILPSRALKCTPSAERLRPARQSYARGANSFFRELSAFFLQQGISPISDISSGVREHGKSIRVLASGQSSPARRCFQRDDHVAPPFAAIPTRFPLDADSPGTTIAVGSTGQFVDGGTSSVTSGCCRRHRLDHRQSSARSTSPARRAFRST